MQGSPRGLAGQDDYGQTGRSFVVAQKVQGRASVPKQARGMRFPTYRPRQRAKQPMWLVSSTQHACIRLQVHQRPSGGIRSAHAPGLDPLHVQQAYRQGR